MITAQEARTNSENLDTSVYLDDLDKWITKASLDGRDHIKLFKKPYSEIAVSYTHLTLPTILLV